MNLKRIRVNGYCNIKNTSINLNQLTSILSLNNYGKSNLFTSIVFGLSFIQQHPRIKQTMMNDNKSRPCLKDNVDDLFSFEIECLETTINSQANIIYSYSFAWPSYKNGYKGRIVSECLKIKNCSQSATTYIKRENDSAFYKSSKTGRCSTKIQISESDLVLNKLLAYDDLFYQTTIKQLHNINVYIDRHFDSSYGYGITFMSEQELTDLTLKPELNIPKTLYRIKESHNDKYQLLINSFISLFPSIKNIYVEEISNKNFLQKTKKQTNDDKTIPFSDKYYLLFVEDKNLATSINFSQMSDGAQRVLLLLTFVVLAQINNYDLICIEEPENSIHPGLLKKFLFTVTELAENTKLLFSSHSPYLINYLNPENIYLGITNDYGLAIFKKLKSSTNAKKRLMKDLIVSNMGLGDYLFDLMSGSDDDIEELLSYVE